MAHCVSGPALGLSPSSHLARLSRARASAQRFPLPPKLSLSPRPCSVKRGLWRSPLEELHRRLHDILRWRRDNALAPILCREPHPVLTIEVEVEAVVEGEGRRAEAGAERPAEAFASSS